jgi:pyruvate dehydrogenase E2 component (dihydrolipoamide acetyltransferase)
MPTPFVMPKMDMDQEVVTIIEWLKKEGEKVTKGEAVVSVETDKITSDIEAPETGTLVGILYHENEEAPVTQVVAYILKEGESLAELPMVNESSQGSVVQSDSDQALGVTTPSLRGDTSCGKNGQFDENRFDQSSIQGRKDHKN